MKKELIERITVGSGGVSSMEFTGIPQDGTHLVMLISSRQISSQQLRWYQINFNNATATEALIFLQGGQGAVASYSYTDINYVYANGGGTAANTFGSTEFRINNYASSSNKSFGFDNATEDSSDVAFLQIGAGLIEVTDAVSSIQVTGHASFDEHTTASLYKVVAE